MSAHNLVNQTCGFPAATVANAARQDPEKLQRQILHRILALQYTLLDRVEHSIRTEIAGADSSNRSPLTGVRACQKSTPCSSTAATTAPTSRRSGRRAGPAAAATAAIMAPYRTISRQLMRLPFGSGAG